MNKENSMNESSMNRRDALKGAAAVSLGLASGALGIPEAFGQTPVGENMIELENAERGTRDWLLTKTDITANEPVALWRSPRIEGYCSETSVSAGDTIKGLVGWDRRTAWAAAKRRFRKVGSFVFSS